jgi:hypothetical protein
LLTIKLFKATSSYPYKPKKNTMKSTYRLSFTCWNDKLTTRKKARSERAQMEQDDPDEAVSKNAQRHRQLSCQWYMQPG